MAEDQAHRPTPDLTKIVLAVNKLSNAPSFLDEERKSRLTDDSIVNDVKELLGKICQVEEVEAGAAFAIEVLEKEPTLVVNLARGYLGQFSFTYVPSILDNFAIPYSGGDPLACTITQDKFSLKSILRMSKIPVPHGQVFKSHEEIRGMSLSFPTIIKPLYGFGGIGVEEGSLVSTKTDLAYGCEAIWEMYDEPALVEEYVFGKEYTICVLGNGPNKTFLPYVESKVDFITHTERISLGTELLKVSTVNPKVNESIQKTIGFAYDALGLRDWATFDVRVDKASGVVKIIDVNPIPDLDWAFKLACKTPDLSVSKAVVAVVGLALERYNYDRDLSWEPA